MERLETGLETVKHPIIPPGVACRKFTGISHDLLHRSASRHLSQTAPSTLQDTVISQEVNSPAGRSFRPGREESGRPQNAKVTRDKDLTIQEENFLLNLDDRTRSAGRLRHKRKNPKCARRAVGFPLFSEQLEGVNGSRHHDGDINCQRSPARRCGDRFSIVLVHRKIRQPTPPNKMVFPIVQKRS